MRKLVSVFALVLTLFAVTYGQEGQKEAAKEKVYFVTTTHTAAQCVQALDELNASKGGLLDKMYFGCHHGDHTSYGFVTGNSEAEVRAMLPASVQKQAKITPVDRITAQELEKAHSK